MKRFIYKVFLFLIPVVIGIYTLEYYFTQTSLKYEMSNGETHLWKEIFDGKIKADAFIYGSSKVWKGYDVPEMNKTSKQQFYSFGFDGHTLDLQYLRHQKIVENNALPSLIILNVDIFTFGFRKSLYQYEQFLPHMLNGHFVYEDLEQFNYFKRSDFQFPLVRYLGNFKTFAKLFRINKYHDTLIRDHGFLPSESSWNGSFEAMLKRRKSNITPISEQVVSKFDSLISFCQRNNINLITVYSPEYYEVYKVWNDYEPYKQEVKEIVLSRNIPLIDFTNDSICFSKDNFYDSQHLNQKGASEFSKQLIDSLIKYNYIDKK